MTSALRLRKPDQIYQGLLRFLPKRNSDEIADTRCSFPVLNIRYSRLFIGIPIESAGQNEKRCLRFLASVNARTHLEKEHQTPF